MSGQALEQGRAAFPAQVWSEAFEQLQAAHAESPLDSEDLELLAVVVYLTGREGARCAIWLCLTMQLRGDHAQGGAWLARVERLLDDGSLDCVE